MAGNLRQQAVRQKRRIKKEQPGPNYGARLPESSAFRSHSKFRRGVFPKTGHHFSERRS
jgi:hypothetical protein